MNPVLEFVRIHDWMDAPSLGAGCEDLDLSTGADYVSAPSQPAVATPETLPPCGMDHRHTRSVNGLWSAGTWLCLLSNLERQDRKTITANLRYSQKFAALRSTGSLVSHPVWLPFLATDTELGTVYRRILSGESFSAIAQELGVL